MAFHNNVVCRVKNDSEMLFNGTLRGTFARSSEFPRDGFAALLRVVCFLQGKLHLEISVFVIPARLSRPEMPGRFTVESKAYRPFRELASFIGLCGMHVARLPSRTSEWFAHSRSPRSGE